ncbi:D-alanyl-D-alanine carboxypeptidase family protein [Streptomyces sp. NPDC050504]|uniref:D-alanyl-D-alanine carboxypeptidase family protein n=1 Tax=Streptomyces sp. NPDC050504 TaxID=3365618 RepID=UPI0037B8FEAF
MDSQRVRTRMGLRGRGGGRGGLLYGSAALVVLVGVGGWQGLAGPADSGSMAAPVRAGGFQGAAPFADRLSLPWPKDGQSSVEAVGLGGLGRTDGQRPVPIASVTKVMTAYVILKGHPLRADEQGPDITVDATAANESFSGSESTVPLIEGRRFSQRRLLELLLLPSGNNVARLLARWDAGSEQAFVAKMNRAAAELGMDRTTYTGASGIEPTTRSTADDQLKLARRAMEQPALRSVVALRSTTVPGVPGTVVNTNRLLEKPGVIGLKTGSSTPAGGNLMWAVEVKAGAKRQLVLGVVLGQRANTSPAEGMAAALDRSGELIEAVQRQLPAALGRPAQVRT